MNLTGRPIYTKGKTEAKTKRKPMRRVSAKKAAEAHPLRENAKGRLCTLRLPGCRGDAEYTVLAHYRRFGWAGAAQKPNDLLGCFACDACHDKQERHECSAEDMLRAMGETLMIQQASGVLKVDASAVGKPEEIDF